MVCELYLKKAVRDKTIELKEKIHKCPLSVIDQAGRKLIRIQLNWTALPNLIQRFQFKWWAGKYLTTALQGKQTLIWSICPFPWYNYSYYGWFQTTNKMSLIMELGRDVHSFPFGASSQVRLLNFQELCELTVKQQVAWNCLWGAVGAWQQFTQIATNQVFLFVYLESVYQPMPSKNTRAPIHGSARVTKRLNDLGQVTLPPWLIVYLSIKEGSEVADPQVFFHLWNSTNSWPLFHNSHIEYSLTSHQGTLTWLLTVVLRPLRMGSEASPQASLFTRPPSVRWDSGM